MTSWIAEECAGGIITGSQEKDEMGAPPSSGAGRLPVHSRQREQLGVSSGRYVEPRRQDEFGPSSMTLGDIGRGKGSEFPSLQIPTWILGIWKGEMASESNLGKLQIFAESQACSGKQVSHWSPQKGLLSC